MTEHQKINLTIFFTLWGVTTVAIWFSHWSWVWCLAVSILAIGFYVQLVDRYIAPHVERRLERKRRRARKETGETHD